jgi:hypothetical protein
MRVLYTQESKNSAFLCVQMVNDERLQAEVEIDAEVCTDDEVGLHKMGKRKAWMKNR